MFWPNFMTLSWTVAEGWILGQFDFWWSDFWSSHRQMARQTESNTYDPTVHTHRWAQKRKVDLSTMTEGDAYKSTGGLKKIVLFFFYKNSSIGYGEWKQNVVNFERPNRLLLLTMYWWWSYYNAMQCHNGWAIVNNKYFWKENKSHACDLIACFIFCWCITW